jgi:hypothetical protein
MFRTSYVHIHEYCIVAHAALCGMFYMCVCQQSVRMEHVLE